MNKADKCSAICTHTWATVTSAQQQISVNHKFTTYAKVNL